MGISWCHPSSDTIMFNCDLSSLAWVITVLRSKSIWCPIFMVLVCFVYVAWIKCPYNSSLSDKGFIGPTVSRHSSSFQWSPYGGSLGSWSHWTHCWTERGAKQWNLVLSELLTASYSQELHVREWCW